MPKHFLNSNPKHFVVNEPEMTYAGTAQLEEALKRSDMEKFLFLMKLVKTQRMLQKMNITHKP